MHIFCSVGQRLRVHCTCYCWYRAVGQLCCGFEGNKVQLRMDEVKNRLFPVAVAADNIWSKKNNENESDDYFLPKSSHLTD